MTDNHVRLDAAAVGRTLDDLSAIGNRWAGGPGEAACRDYLVERLRAVGHPETALEPFPYVGFEAGRASCAVAGHPELVLECHALQYTAPGEAAGEAVYLGEAGDADFARLDAHGVSLAGKVVLAHTVFPFDLCDELTRREIAGLVHICETPDGIVGTFAGALYPPPLAPPWPGRPVPYAGVTIGHAAGRALLSAMTAAGPLEITLGHDGALHERETANIVTTIPGSDPDAGHVIVCAHYDSQREGDGIFDNGGGLAGLLELARVLPEAGPRRAIALVATAAEEIGVWGATAYTARHAAELAAAAAMVNLDGVATAYPSQREIWSAHPGLAVLAEQTARDMGWRPDRVNVRRSTFGDHAPFGDAGVPSCLVWRPDFPYYHSRGDIRERVDAAAVAETASVSANLVLALARGATVRGA